MDEALTPGLLERMNGIRAPAKSQTEAWNDIHKEKRQAADQGHASFPACFCMKKSPLLK